VLVIDDEEDVRAGMEKLLEGWGCRVLAVASRGEALAALAEEAHVPDLVISDYLLEAGDTGPAAIAAVRARSGRAIPALVVTGEIDRVALAPLVASGLPMLRKPVAPVRLRAALAHFLGEG
jgi:CheY-like chemotaxis protein